MNNFITVFNELLEENKLNIKQLSRILKVHCSILYSYVNENYLPSVKTAVKLANYFNCSIDFLMGLDEVKLRTAYKEQADISVFYLRYEKLLNEEKLHHFTLCNKTELNVSSLEKWKKGREPRMDSLIIIAKYFDVSIEYLIGRTDKK